MSIFVNPIQFGPREDFTAYPREEAADLGKLAKAGADLVFAPDAAEMYPPSFTTHVKVFDLTDDLCWRSGDPIISRASRRWSPSSCSNALPTSRCSARRTTSSSSSSGGSCATSQYPGRDRGRPDRTRGGRARAFLAQRLSHGRTAQDGSLAPPDHPARLLPISLAAKALTPRRSPAASSSRQHISASTMSRCATPTR